MYNKTHKGSKLCYSLHTTDTPGKSFFNWYRVAVVIMK